MKAQDSGNSEAKILKDFARCMVTLAPRQREDESLPVDSAEFGRIAGRKAIEAGRQARMATENREDPSL
jgi:hypothetical protein